MARPIDKAEWMESIEQRSRIAWDYYACNRLCEERTPAKTESVRMQNSSGKSRPSSKCKCNLSHKCSACPTGVPHSSGQMRRTESNRWKSYAANKCNAPTHEPSEKWINLRKTLIFPRRLAIYGAHLLCGTTDCLEIVQYVHLTRLMKPSWTLWSVSLCSPCIRCVHTFRPKSHSKTIVCLLVSGICHIAYWTASTSSHHQLVNHHHSHIASHNCRRSLKASIPLPFLTPIDGIQLFLSPVRYNGERERERTDATQVEPTPTEEQWLRQKYAVKYAASRMAKEPNAVSRWTDWKNTRTTSHTVAHSPGRVSAGASEVRVNWRRRQAFIARAFYD